MARALNVAYACMADDARLDGMNRDDLVAAFSDERWGNAPVMVDEADALDEWLDGANIDSLPVAGGPE